jgi:hypothetical protein
MLTLFTIFIVNATPAFAEGTVPINVIRLPEYEDDQTPKRADPVADKVKSFDLDSANGWYDGGGGSASSGSRKPSNLGTLEQEDSAVDPKGAPASNEPTPYVDAGPYGNTDSSTVTATVTTQNPTGTVGKKKKKNGDEQSNHRKIQRQIDEANKAADAMYRMNAGDPVK